MTDLTNLDSVSGSELTSQQIQGILKQIDLDITNLVREGKLSALKYSVPGKAGQSTDRAANLNALLTARAHYQHLLNTLPAWSTSQAVLTD
ncbi:hypothetical protein [Thalassoglobus sp.]|uniref:hypothetical protein n=1 Tax=Thalassoglobus sp. TaxID=2795869 RepID=UPI003AA9A8C1